MPTPRLSMLALLCLACASLACAADRKPNFVYVFTDDQRWDALGVVQQEQGEKGRFPWLKTPNLDRLAREGLRFRNAFVVNSLCAPSRASLVTGQYGHVNGVTNNHTPHPEGNLSLAALLLGGASGCDDDDNDVVDREYVPGDDLRYLEWRFGLITDANSGDLTMGAVE